MGRSLFTSKDRQVDDYYATEPKAALLLLKEEAFSNTVWECACGGGHLSYVLEYMGYNVISSDIKNRGYKNTKIIDFLTFGGVNTFDIITNPPYKYAGEFVRHALDISIDNVKVAMFLKLTFLESQERKKLFMKYPPKVIYVSSSRLRCAKGGDFKNIQKI